MHFRQSPTATRPQDRPGVSSNTEQAPRTHGETLQGGTRSNNLSTLVSESKKTKSMGKCMKNVWTMEQEGIQRPSSSEKSFLPIHPCNREKKVRAAFTDPATLKPRVRFQTLIAMYCIKFTRIPPT